MFKVSSHSFYMEAETKEQLLEDINDWWKWFYDKNWNNGAYSYEGLKFINDNYFYEEFSMTKQEASERLEELKMKMYCSQAWSHVKLKLAWYIKYGPQGKPVDKRQMTLDDFLNEETKEKIKENQKNVK